MINPLSDSLFGSSLWDEALEKYGAAAGLTVQLFDEAERPVLGPVHPTPLIELFAATNYNLRSFTQSAHACIGLPARRPAVLVSRDRGLTVVGASLSLEGRIVGAAVAGYAFTEFSQVSEMHRLAHEAGIPFQRLWAVARQQQPISERRLVVLGELLQTLGDALLRENLRTRQYQHAAAIVSSSGDAIISENLFGIITGWNQGAERLFGYTSEEAMGKPANLLIPPWHKDEEPNFLKRIREGESIEHFETERRRKDGAVLDISLTVSPVTNPRGRVVGASNIARDITRRKRTEEALAQTQAQLTDHASLLERLVAERTARLQETISDLEHFSYSITHDMRAPLRAMQGFAEMMLRESGEKLTPRNLEYLDRIIQAGLRMDALVRDSLQYARALREHAPLSPVEPAPILRNILESYPNLQPPGVEISIVEPLPAVVANASGLAQCFSNLLINAAKFVRPGARSKIRVWAEEAPPSPPANGSPPPGPVPPGFARFWFEDNGIGILPEHQSRIFGIFQRLDKSYEGTGIGLALVRKTAERMEGKVGVESDPGNGSRFWLEFRKVDA